MLNDIFTWLNTLITGNFYIALIGAFLWGVLSILLSPCHLSSIPLVIGYINKQGVQNPKIAFINSAVFSAGILATIAIIGLVTSALGGLISDIGTAGNYLVAIVFFAAGLYLLDVIRFDFRSSNIKRVSSKGYTMAFVLGILFGLGLGPCTFAFMAPVLGVAFQFASISLLSAVLLISAFTIGHCTVIVAAGTVSTKVQVYLNWTENSMSAVIIKKVCGVLVLLGGVYFLYLTL
jgi:cytochrome c-type biogenesis protein